VNKLQTECPGALYAARIGDLKLGDFVQVEWETNFVTDTQLNEADILRLFAALTSEVKNQFNISGAGQIFRTSGFVLTGSQYWQPLMQAVDTQFIKFPFDVKMRTVRILAERLLDQPYKEGTGESVKSLLLSHGFQFIAGNFVPIGLFDERELGFLPEMAAGEISTALDRLIGGDLDGAISAVCGTVETAASAVADIAGADSFQQKTKIAIDAAGRLSALHDQLVRLGWKTERAAMLCHNLRGTLNQAAMVMQILRSEMSDVHGAKLVLETVVYDSLKLASMLVLFMR
jgi:hypothetical protein